MAEPKNWMTPVEMVELWDCTGPAKRTGTIELEVLWTGLDHLDSQTGLAEEKVLAWGLGWDLNPRPSVDHQSIRL